VKRILALILLLAVLCGCAQKQTPIDTEPSLPLKTPGTTEPPTDPTDPPDPLVLLLDSMTADEKVGQLFLARCPDAKAVEDIVKYHLGGYILFARDFENETPESVRTTISTYQAASPIGMLIAVDEEGGSVTRISRYKAFRDTKFPSPRSLYSQGGIPKIQETETEKCQFLTSIGVNVNVGPVCDVTTDRNAFMYSRSLGQSPEITGQFAAMMVGVMAENKIGGILKHFPGYGNNTDTHVGIARDDRSLAQLEANDLVPFAAAIQYGCDAIMVSHVYINALDDQLPATLSPSVHRYLRENMGFGGVIVTDDLVMDAITKTYGAGEAAVLAVLAGNDLLCSTEYAVQYDAVLQAVKDGRIPMDQLNASVYRLLRWKQELGLIK